MTNTTAELMWIKAILWELHISSHGSARLWCEVLEGAEWWACERSEPWKKFFALDLVCAVRTRWNLHRKQTAQRSLTNNQYDLLIPCLENRFTPQHVLQEPNKEANRVAKNSTSSSFRTISTRTEHWFSTPSHSREAQGIQRTRADGPA
jgi:hypothetical protein